MTFQECADRVGAIGVSCLCDADKQLRVFDPGIRPLVPGLRLFGRARPVACRDDFLPVIMGLKAADAGDVLVIATTEGRTAVAGELFSTEAKRKGLAGLVVDGAVRDVAAVREHRWPVYTRLITPMAGTTRDLAAAVDVVTCGGVSVRLGDLVIGDDDGLVVTSEAELEAILPAAETIHRSEAEVLRRMASGHSLVDLLTLDEHLDGLRAGRETQLRFRL